MNIALITGGNRGLGKAAALALADQGTDVLVTYRGNEQEAKDVVAEIRAKGRTAAALQLEAGDVSTFPTFRDQVVATLRDTFGATTLDALVLNAGHSDPASFLETTEQQFDGLMDVHLKGVFFLAQTLVPLMGEGSRIVTMSSGLARFCRPGHAAYGVMKGGVEVLTRYLAAELGPRGITANCVAPGPVATDFGGGFVRDNSQAQEHLAAAAALGRVGLPDDIGPVVAAILSPAFAFVTGQRIEASGGTLL